MPNKLTHLLGFLLSHTKKMHCTDEKFIKTYTITEIFWIEWMHFGSYKFDDRQKSSNHNCQRYIVSSFRTLIIHFPLTLHFTAQLTRKLLWTSLNKTRWFSKRAVELNYKGKMLTVSRRLYTRSLNFSSKRKYFADDYGGYDVHHQTIEEIYESWSFFS